MVKYLFIVTSLCSVYTYAHKISCATQIINYGQITKIWQNQTISHSKLYKRDLLGILIKESAEFFIKKNKLPTKMECIELVSRYYPDITKEQITAKVEQVFEPYKKDSTWLLRASLQEIPGVYEGIFNKIDLEIMRFFKEHIRIPSMSEISQIVNLSEEYLKILIINMEHAWQKANKKHQEYFFEAKKKIMAAFVRAMKQVDVPEHFKTQAHTPELEEIYYALIRTEANKKLIKDASDSLFTIEHFKMLLGSSVKKSKDRLSLFNGIAELEKEAKVYFPKSFNSYISNEFNIEYSEETKRILEKSSGALVCSVNLPAPLIEGLVKIMIKIADERDIPILIFPTSQVLAGLDNFPILKHPRIRFIVNTIENEYLKLSQIPIIPKNQNGLASLDLRKIVLPGQTMIVGHPQLTHMVLPTSSNHIRDTALWSPGSISQDVYPIRHPIQGKPSTIAKGLHTAGFLVLEKADKKSGTMGEGVQNFWHVRPVEYFNDTKYGGREGVIDLGKQYSVVNNNGTQEIEVTQQGPKELVLGDFHDWIADQRILKKYLEFIKKHPSIDTIYFEDPMDNLALNHHERKKVTLLIEKFLRGELNSSREFLGFVQTVNAILAIRPNIKIVIKDSNHDYWPNNVVDQPTDAQMIMNGHFLAELAHARRVLKARSVMEYIFNYRNDYIKALPVDVRLEYESKMVQVADPRRVQVLAFGKPHVVGTHYRPVHLNFHGHQGSNGAKASLKTHSSASQNAIVGDAHQSAILGGLMRVGTSTPKKIGYNDAGYSSWNHSFAVVYKNGTKQLITYSSLADAIYQEEGVGVLPPSLFFGSNPLEVKPTDNQIAPGMDVIDVHSQWLDMMSNRVSKK